MCKWLLSVDYYDNNFTVSENLLLCQAVPKYFYGVADTHLKYLFPGSGKDAFKQHRRNSPETRKTAAAGEWRLNMLLDFLGA